MARTLHCYLPIACSLLFLVAACARPLVSPEVSATLDTPPLDSVYLEVDEYPTPVGGMRAAQLNVDYPAAAWRQRIQGTVLVRFVVDEEGITRDLEVVESVHGSLDQAAMRAIRKTRFVPGRKDGRPVRVQMSMPISFGLH